jgi:two-component system, LytTR family, sensor histidine kinase AlgZ
MHPFFRRPRHLLYALLFWSPLSLGLAALLRLLTGTGLARAILLAFPVMFFLLLGAISTWFICRFTPLAGNSLFRLSLTHLTGSVFLAFVVLLFLHFYTALLAAIDAAGKWPEIEIRVRLLFLFTAAIIYFLSILFHYLLAAMEKNREAEKKLLQAELVRSRFELQAMRATIHPHFLFNSLTALSGLIVKEPGQAREICLQLADFLRYTLKMTQHHRISLGEELEHLGNYLAIESMRLGTRLSVVWRIEPGLLACLLPPMLLQPLLENAVKHGIQPRLDGGCITFQTRASGPELEFIINNPLPEEEFRPLPGTGLGLKTIRRRLADEFGRQAWLKTERTVKEFSVSLVLPRVEKTASEV